MKKYFFGLVSILISQIAIAADVSDFEGRYAKNCDTKSAHKLSYVIGEQTMARLIDAQAQYAAFKESDSEQNLSNEQNKLSRRYGDYKVDLFHNEGKNFAQVDYLGDYKKEPHTKGILKQCNNPNPMS